MGIKLSRLCTALGLAVILAGCSDEKVPEPNAANCAPDMYEKNLASLSKEANRNTFIANCKSLLESKKLTDWTFKKSPKDDF